MDRLAVSKAKVLRGNVIERLYNFYGEDITVATLKNVLSYSGYNSDQELKKALYYLTGEDKRYVKLNYNEDNYLDSTVWLTPKGVNLAEGDLEDVGVNINE